MKYYLISAISSDLALPSYGFDSFSFFLAVLVILVVSTHEKCSLAPTHRNFVAFFFFFLAYASH